jgi:hypothetical protein
MFSLSPFFLSREPEQCIQKLPKILWSYFLVIPITHDDYDVY